MNDYKNGRGNHKPKKPKIEMSKHVSKQGVEIKRYIERISTELEKIHEPEDPYAYAVLIANVGFACGSALLANTLLYAAVSKLEEIRDYSQSDDAKKAARSVLHHVYQESLKDRSRP